MTNKVDGMGPCPNNTSDDPNDQHDRRGRHEWRYGLTRQQNAPPPRLQGAKPDPARIVMVFHCIYCLELRELEVAAPVVAPVVVQNVLAMASQAGLAH